MSFPLKINQFLNKDTKLFSTTFLDQSVVSAGNFLTTFLIIKFIGLEAFGLFSAIWIIIISTNTIQQAIITNPLLSISTKLKGKFKEKYISVMQTNQIIFSLITSLIIFLLVIFNKKFFGLGFFDNKDILYFVISMSIIQFYEFIRRTFYVESKLKDLLKMDLLKYIIQIFLICFFLSYGFKSSKTILTIINFASICCIFFFSNNLPKVNLHYKDIFSSFIRNWDISKWLILSSFVQWIQSNYLLFLTNFMLGPIALGVLRASQSILGISHILLHSIDSWLTVKTSKELIIESKNIFRNKIKRLIKNFSIFFFISFSFLILISKFILILFDKSMVNYLFTFRLYCITYLIMSLNYPIKSILLGIEKTFSSFISYGLSVLLILLLGKTLINNFGLDGTVLTFIFSQLIMFLTNVYYLKRKIQYLK